ncbi:helix-turn-helix domain-containing protein [Sphingobacterium psychroaquaticum]|uniref:helix-turn-helix domain-containing protein n=1 Tax=Sphingobacterium psychroaquaticum TaxID=561061 RepID=UPI001F0E312C|nr:AraC family transcriptional regulator [Sphingobacterium psychroaquaticum]
MNFEFKLSDEGIADFVYCFSALDNMEDIREGIIIPNGRVDLVFAFKPEKEIEVTLLGLETKPKKMPDRNYTKFYSVSFNPLALEYILQISVADVLDNGKILPVDFWDLPSLHSMNFEQFCSAITNKVHSKQPTNMDERKRKLFRLIFDSNGAIGIRELSYNIGWSERQINRYFNQQLGLPIKTYCNILRFQAALPYIKEGKLAPQLNYTDQSHFIKEIKKLSGVSPKELFKNENDRFLQFLTVAKP